MKYIHGLPYTMEETEDGFMIAAGGIFIGKIFKKIDTEDFIKARPEKAGSSSMWPEPQQNLW